MSLGPGWEQSWGLRDGGGTDASPDVIGLICPRVFLPNSTAVHSFLLRLHRARVENGARQGIFVLMTNEDELCKRQLLGHPAAPTQTSSPHCYRTSQSPHRTLQSGGGLMATGVTGRGGGCHCQVPSHPPGWEIGPLGQHYGRLPPSRFLPLGLCSSFQACSPELSKKERRGERGVCGHGRTLPTCCPAPPQAKASLGNPPEQLPTESGQELGTVRPVLGSWSWHVK